MAARYWVGGTANWDATAGTKWSDVSGGAGGFSVPTSADDVFFDAASGAVTVTISTVTANCLSFNCTGFTGTLAGTASFNVSGNVTIVAGMTITYSGEMQIITNPATLTSNGKTWNGGLKINSITATLFDNWTVNGLFTPINCTINDNTLSLNGSISAVGSSSGTTNIEYNGTGTWSGVGQLKNNLTINTAGTLTVSGSVGYNTGTLTYTAGTVTTTGSVLIISAATTLDTSGIIWNAITFITLNSTITLLSDLVSVGFIQHTNSGIITFNGFNFYIGGSITLSNGRTFNGTTKIIFNTSTSQTINVDNAYAGGIRNNLDINATGTVNIAWLAYGGGTLTYIAGTVIFSSFATLAIASSCTLNVSGINWRTVGIFSAVTITLTSDLICNGTLSIGAGASSGTFNGNTLYLGGNLTLASNATIGMTGTTNIIYNGIGTWNHTGSSAVRNNFTVSALANLTFGSSVRYNIGTLTIEKQARITTRANASLIISNSCTLINIHKCAFKNITISSNQTITMNEFFSGSPENKSVIRVTGGSANYKIVFTDDKSKKAFFVNVRNCTVQTSSNQLNIIGRDSNAGFNTGIIFGEAGLNGFPLNQYGTDNSYSFTDGFSQGGMNN